LVLVKFFEANLIANAEMEAKRQKAMQICTACSAKKKAAPESAARLSFEFK
jgi:hypothetical protein